MENLYTRFTRSEFKKVGTKKLTWNGSNIKFDIVKVNINELKYNVLNGRIAELDLDTNVKLDEAVYTNIKNSIIKSSMKSLVDLGKDIGKAKLKEPLIINKDGIIIDGNRRYTAISMLLEGEIKPFAPTDIADLEWVEAVILDSETETISIKQLEYSIQFDDMKRDYDPISRAFDFAKSHIKLKMPIEAISHSTGINQSEILKDIRTVKLIRVYLHAIGSPNDIKLAIDLKLDGPMKEIASNKTNTKHFLSNQSELVNIITIAKQAGGDITRNVRDLVKSSVRNGGENIINSPVVRETVKNIVDNVDIKNTITNAYNAKTTKEKVSIISSQENSNSIVSSLNDLQSKLTSKSKADTIKISIDKFYDSFKEVDGESFKELAQTSRSKLKKIKEIIIKNE